MYFVDREHTLHVNDTSELHDNVNRIVLRSTSILVCFSGVVVGS